MIDDVSLWVEGYEEAYSALPSRERAALLDDKRMAFLEALAHQLDALGANQKGGVSSCFRQKRGRTAIPVRTKP